MKTKIETSGGDNIEVNDDANNFYIKASTKSDTVSLFLSVPEGCDIAILLNGKWVAPAELIEMTRRA